MLVSFVFSLFVNGSLHEMGTTFEFCQNENPSKQHKEVRKQSHFIVSDEVENFHTTGTRKKNDANSVDGFCGQCNVVFEAMGCYYHYYPCQEARFSLTDEEIQRGIKKREPEELRKQYIQEKGYNVIEMYECDWSNIYKT